MGNVDPARVQSRARDFLDPRQGLGFNFTELSEVDNRNRRQCSAARRGYALRRSTCRTALGEEVLYERFDVVLSDPSLEPATFDQSQVDAKLAREFAY